MNLTTKDNGVQLKKTYQTVKLETSDGGFSFYSVCASFRHLFIICSSKVRIKGTLSERMANRPRIAHEQVLFFGVCFAF